MRLPGWRNAGLFLHQRYSVPVAATLVIEGARQTGPGRTVIGAVVIALLLSPVAVSPRPLIWVALAALAGAYGMHINRRHQLIDPERISLRALQLAEYRCALYGALAGTAWGAISYLMVPGEAFHNLLIFLLLMGFVSMSVTNWLFGILRGMLGIATGLVVFVSGLPQAFPGEWPSFAVAMILFTVLTFVNSWHRALTYYENYALRDENAQLLAIQKAETARANRANRDKSAFMAAASHDLRQPLHALMLTGDALSSQLRDAGQRALLKNMTDAGRALSDQFNQLLDLSRIESGDYQPQPRLIALQSFVDDALAAHRDTALHKGLALRSRIDRRLQDLAIEADAGLLTRIVHNLLNNAIKYSDGGGILLAVRHRGQGLVIQIHDQGVGIADEFQNEVFKPYTQLRNARSGIGLGLSIVAEAAATLGLGIGLRSRPGHGSSFSIEVPASLLQAAPAEATLESPTPAGPIGLVLFVDDDPTVGASLSDWARSRGLNFRHCARPDDVSIELRPDRIVCDIHLADGENGIDWLLRWQTWWPQARGLLVSGDCSPATLERIEDEGLLLLPKPLDPNLLYRALTA